MIPMPIRACKVTSSNCNLFTRDGVQRGERFVHKQYGRRQGQYPSERNPLFLSTGKLCRNLILPTGKPGQCQHVESPRTPSGGGDTRGLKSDLHVFQRRQPREQRGLLKHHRPIRAGATARPAFQRHCARIWRIEPSEDIQ